MSRFLFFVILLLGTATSYLAWNKTSVVQDFLANHFEAKSKDIVTVEAKITPEQVINVCKQQLDNEYTVVDQPQLLFSPYLMMEVKYLEENKNSSEGVVLWDMSDGEMVLDTNSWATTQGFKDCMSVNANRNDFLVLNTLLKNGRAMDRLDLVEILRIKNDTLSSWLNKAQEKNLIVMANGQWQPHLSNVNIMVDPQTVVDQHFVTKSYAYPRSLPKRFSWKQIEKTAKAAFGRGFTVSSHKQVFVPVYMIKIENQEGIQETAFWNALNGKRIYPKLFSGV